MGAHKQPLGGGSLPGWSTRDRYGARSNHAIACSRFWAGGRCGKLSDVSARVLLSRAPGMRPQGGRRPNHLAQAGSRLLILGGEPGIHHQVLGHCGLVS